MRITNKTKNATLYQIHDGAKELLGQIPLEKHRHNYMVRIPPYLLKKAARDDFFLRLPRSVVKNHYGTPLQICHGRFVYDVFINWHIIYALPIIETYKGRLNYGHT